MSEPMSDELISRAEAETAVTIAVREAMDAVVKPKFEAMEAEIRTLRGLLKSVEWGGEVGYSCPKCGASDPRESTRSAHHPACALAAALKEVK